MTYICNTKITLLKWWFGDFITLNSGKFYIFHLLLPPLHTVCGFFNHCKFDINGLPIQHSHTLFLVFYSIAHCTGKPWRLPGILMRTQSGYDGNYGCNPDPTEHRVCSWSNCSKVQQQQKFVPFIFNRQGTIHLH